MGWAGVTRSVTHGRFVGPARASLTRAADKAKAGAALAVGLCGSAARSSVLACRAQHARLGPIQFFVSPRLASFTGATTGLLLLA